VYREEKKKYGCEADYLQAARWKLGRHVLQAHESFETLKGRPVKAATGELRVRCSGKTKVEKEVKCTIIYNA